MRILAPGHLGQSSPMICACFSSCRCHCSFAILVFLMYIIYFFKTQHINARTCIYNTIYNIPCLNTCCCRQKCRRLHVKLMIIHTFSIGQRLSVWSPGSSFGKGSSNKNRRSQTCAVTSALVFFLEAAQVFSQFSCRISVTREKVNAET